MDSARTEKTRFTRMCIAEAIIELLQKTPLKQLHVSDVVQKAGVSRMTFYKHYTSLEDALDDYLHGVIKDYMSAGPEGEEQTAFLSYEHILFSLRFFDRYRKFFLTMKRHGLYSMLIDSVNEFIAEHIPVSQSVSLYKRYSYAGGLLNCFLKWEESERKDSAEDIAMTIHQLFGAIG